MSELRQNMVTREWVIIATERARRPEEFAHPSGPRASDHPTWDPVCHFCPGNEETDLEVLRIPDEGPWRVLVVKNKFPALQVDGEMERTFDGVHRCISGVGYHEVLVETPVHNTCPALETPDEVALMMEAFRRRGRIIASDPQIEQILYFKNHGPRAGTTVVHPHTQLIGLPMVPIAIQGRMEQSRRFFENTGRCAMCQMWMDEARDGTRMVIESDHFVAFIPYAAFSPFHTWIVPRRHKSSFLNATDREVEDLGHILHTLLRKIYVGLADPDYNYIIRSAPIRDVLQEHIHWYISIVPRLSQSAGFELGSGMYINPTLPEDSAVFLRSVQE